MTYVVVPRIDTSLHVSHEHLEESDRLLTWFDPLQSLRLFSDVEPAMHDVTASSREEA